MWPGSPPAKENSHARLPTGPACFFSPRLLTLQVDSLVTQLVSLSLPFFHNTSTSHPPSSPHCVFTFCCSQPPPPPLNPLSSRTISTASLPPRSGTHRHIMAIHRGQGRDIIPRGCPAINNTTWIIRGLCAAIFNHTQLLPKCVARVARRQDRMVQKICFGIDSTGKSGKTRCSLK